MSMIVHRCDCGHPDLFHSDRADGNHQGCSYGACNSRIHNFGEPEVIPSWDSDIKGKSAEIEAVTAPGTRIQGYPHKTCDCADCHALYASVA